MPNLLFMRRKRITNVEGIEWGARQRQLQRGRGRRGPKWDREAYMKAEGFRQQRGGRQARSKCAKQQNSKWIQQPS